MSSRKRSHMRERRQQLGVETIAWIEFRQISIASALRSSVVRKHDYMLSQTFAHPLACHEQDCMDYAIAWYNKEVDAIALLKSLAAMSPGIRVPARGTPMDHGQLYQLVLIFTARINTLIAATQTAEPQDELGKFILQSTYQHRSKTQGGAACNLRLSDRRHLQPQHTLRLGAILLISIDALSPAHSQSCTLEEQTYFRQQTLLPTLSRCSSHTT